MNLQFQVWLLYHHPNFKYCTLFVSGAELRTDKQTDRQTDDPITRCPRRTFQAGGIKTTETQLCVHKLLENHVSTTRVGTVIAACLKLAGKLLIVYPREDAGGLSREYVLLIPSVS